jgi:response regulator of citrate/malate metabolism
MIKAVVLTRDKELRDFIHLAAEGLEVKIAGDCHTLKEATDIFRQESVKIVVVDLFLGESTGLDAIKALKKMDETLAIILISRMSGRGLLDKAFRFGAGDTLIYPCEAEVLRQTIAHRLSRIDDGMITFHE